MREAKQMPRDLQSTIRELECLASSRTARVLRFDETLEHLEMRRFDPASQAVSHLPRKPAHLGNDPLQQVTRKDHRGRL